MVWQTFSLLSHRFRSNRQTYTLPFNEAAAITKSLKTILIVSAERRKRRDHNVVFCEIYNVKLTQKALELAAVHRWYCTSFVSHKNGKINSNSEWVMSRPKKKIISISFCQNGLSLIHPVFAVAKWHVSSIASHKWKERNSIVTNIFEEKSSLKFVHHIRRIGENSKTNTFKKKEKKTWTQHKHEPLLIVRFSNKNSFFSSFSQTFVFNANARHIVHFAYHLQAFKRNFNLFIISFLLCSME